MAKEIKKEHVDRILAARSKRLGTSIEDMTRDSGWFWVVRDEVINARDSMGDVLIGGEELIAAIEAQAEVATKEVAP